MTHKNELISIAVVRKALKEWRKERYLTRENQLSGLINNLLEEVNELKEAKDDYEKVDALCDMAVFSINVLTEDFSLTLIEDSKPLEYSDFEAYLVDINNALESYSDDEINTTLQKFISDMFICIEELGFNWFKCMVETFKEINSRTGQWNESKKKWIKDKSPEAKANWYRANYKECRNEM